MWSLPKLPALEVLGFDFYPAYLVRGLVEFLDLNLPRGLTALHLYARVGQADMEMQDWMDFVSRFLPLYSSPSRLSSCG